MKQRWTDYYMNLLRRYDYYGFRGGAYLTNDSLSALWGTYIMAEDIEYKWYEA